MSFRKASIGDTRTVKTKKGRTITMKKVKPFGKNKNLSWKVVSNKETIHK